MLHASVRDLLWRKRRYLISTIGCALVFSMCLLLAWLYSSFGTELDGLTSALSARSYVVAEGVKGPFATVRPFPAAQLPRSASPFAMLPQIANPDEPVSVVLIGVEPGSAIEPKVISGRSLRSSGEALVADVAPFRTGDRVAVGDKSFRVVGRVDRLSLNGGMFGVVAPLEDVQAALFDGAPFVTAGVVTQAAALDVPKGLHQVTSEAATEDGLRMLAGARKSINFITIILWLVAVLILASVIFLSAVERTRDFAVFKAIGVSTRSMAAGLMLQSVLLAFIAALIGVAVAAALAPSFPVPVSPSTGSAILLPILAVLVGALASLFGLRRAVSVEPALAFGGGGG